MMRTEQQWALVTGASSGLGIEFARALAARQINLVLAARREEPMLKLAAELKAQHGVHVIVEAVDLSKADSAASLQRSLDVRQIVPDILINNAAFGLSSAFVNHDPTRLREMLQLDIVALTELTYLFGKRMAERGHGHILMVASLAAYNPTPLLAAYGAAKAYVLSLGHSLHVELAPKVGVTVLSPGLMETGFFEVSGYQMKAAFKRTMLAPSTVAAIGLRALFARRPSVVAGRLNRVTTFITQFLSRHSQAKMVYRISKA